MTLVKIKGKDKRLFDSWRRVGKRVWALPEALLSKNIVCRVGNNEVVRRNLRKLINFAYEDSEETYTRVNHYTNKGDRLPREKFVDLITTAIWMHKSRPRHASKDAMFASPGLNLKQEYTTEKVYALLGLLSYRILADPRKSEEDAAQFKMNELPYMPSRYQHIHFYGYRRSSGSHWSQLPQFHFRY